MKKIAILTIAACLLAGLLGIYLLIGRDKSETAISKNQESAGMEKPAKKVLPEKIRSDYLRGFKQYLGEYHDAASALCQNPPDPAGLARKCAQIRESMLDLVVPEEMRAGHLEAVLKITKLNEIFASPLDENGRKTALAMIEELSDIGGRLPLDAETK